MSCVNWNNQGAVTEASSQQWKSAFLDELQSKQGDGSSTPNNCPVSVFLERTPAEIVLTAEIENGNGLQHLFAAISRPGIPAETNSSGSPRLEKEILWQQSERILDAIFVRAENGGNDRLIFLQMDSLIIQERQSGVWKMVLSKPLGEMTLTQRASRGELSFSMDQPDKVKISFAVKSCQATLNDRSTLICQPGSEQARTGMLLASTCDSRVWWLRGDGGDSTVPDRFELVNSAAPQSQPPVAELPTPGPILSISSGEALRADTAVVFNLATGNYEIYRIALACGQ
ncbi:MAG TPA: hypothetical protein VKD70_04675 [Candidatus Acidoferrum sp.]|nr:hypothetical protein [Candidatus Acidoferrum sp.]